MKTIHTFISVSGIAFLFICLSGCTNNHLSDGSDLQFSDGSIRISGRLGADYFVENSRSFNPGDRSISSAVSHIGAFNVISDGLNAGNPEGIFGEVEEDGDFSLSVPKEQDKVLMLVNSTSDDPRNICLGFATLQGDLNTLVNIPLSNALRDIDFGEMSKVDEEAVSETSYLTSDDLFDLPADTLDELAATDDLVKAVLNSYINYDPETGTSYRAAVRFDWYAQSAPGTFFSPDDYAYSGYGISIATNDVGHYSFDEILQKQKVLALFPPGEVNSENSHTYGPEIPFDTSDVEEIVTSAGQDFTCQEADDDDFGLCYYPDGAYYYDEAYYLLGISGPGAGITDTSVPEGFWTLKLIDGEDLAVFDFSVSSPLGVSGKPTIPIPLWRINIDGASNRVTSIDLRFVRYDERSSSYIEITDLNVLERLSASSLMLQIDDFTGTTSNPERINEGFHLEDLSPITDFQNSWYTEDSGRTDVPVIELVNVAYSVGQSWFFFAE